MKPFNLANYDALNLEIVVAGQTFKDEDFKLSSTLGLTLKGRKAEFDLFSTAKEAAVNIITSTGSEPYLLLSIKHPISFNGLEITCQLDLEPPAKNLSYTTLDGVALPYSFGRPHVKGPLVSEKVYGVVSEDQHALTYANVASIFDAYLQATPALAQVSLFGLDTDRASELSSLQDFYKVLSSLKELMPSKASILEEFYPLVAWRGVTNAYQGKDAAENFVYLRNVGLPPAISIYSILQFDAHDAVDSATTAEYSARPTNMYYRNKITGQVKTLDQLHTYYLGLSNQLLAVSNELRIDIDYDSPDPITLKIQGLLVTGTYSAGALSVTSRGPESVSWAFTPSGHSKINAPSAAGRDLVNKYVRVQVASQYVGSGTQSYTFTGAVKVLAQDGAILELDPLPFQNYATNTSSNVETQVYSYGSTLAAGMILTGTILAISETVEGASYQGVVTLYRGDYSWPEKRLVEVPAYYIHTDPDPFASPQPDQIDVLINYQEFATVDSKYTGAFVELGGSLISSDVALRNKSAYAYAFQGTALAWSVLAGDLIELDTDYHDTYVVDVRPDMPVLTVKAKVGELYVDVPVTMYVVINIPVDEIQVTGVKILQNLPAAGFSNTLVFQVDSSQYSVEEILTPLISSLGQTPVIDAAFVALPNFAIYGYTDILDTIKEIVEQSKGGLTLSLGAIKAKYLATLHTADGVFDLNNIESFSLNTTDPLELVTNTKVTWDSLEYDKNSAIIKLPDQPETYDASSTKEVTIFNDAEQAKDFGIWWVHRKGRAWDRVELIGFVTDLHLEEYDHITFSLEGMSVLGEIESVSYDHESGEVSLDIVLGDNLWEVGTGFLIGSNTGEPFKVSNYGATFSAAALFKSNGYYNFSDSGAIAWRVT